MKQLLQLTRILWKGGGSFNVLKKVNRKKKQRAVGNAVLVTIMAIYFVGMSASSSLGLHTLLAPFKLQDLVISLYLSAGTLLVFLLGLLNVISSFYYAGDIENLLPLPLPPGTIIGAKLLVVALWQYIYLAVIMLAPVITYAIKEQAGFLFYILSVVVFFLLPVIPLCMASVIVIIIMRFTPFARNKDRFNLVSGLLALFLALGFTFSIQSLGSLNEATLVSLIETGGRQIAHLTASAFPGVKLAVGALTLPLWPQRLGQVGLLVLADALFVAVALFCAKKWYFTGVLEVSSSAAKRKKMSVSQWSRIGKLRPPAWRYCLKDFRILLRTPVFFMNSVVMTFLWPVFFLGPMLVAGEGGLKAFGDIADKIFTNPQGGSVSIVLAGFFAVVCLISGGNGIAASALSREGPMFFLLKTLPFSWRRQIAAKIGVAVLFSLAGVTVPVVALFILLQPPFWLILMLLALIPGAVLLPNTVAMIFDLYWPKLNWTDEQQAIKQNFNVLYAMGSAILAATLFSLPIILLKPPPGLTLLSLVAGSIIITGLVWLIIRKILPRRMAQIEP